MRSRIGVRDNPTSLKLPVFAQGYAPASAVASKNYKSTLTLLFQRRESYEFLIKTFRNNNLITPILYYFGFRNYVPGL
jgi:hypothetical protein